MTVVQTAWEKPVQSLSAIRVLHIKLCRTAKALRKWSKGLTRWEKFISVVADEIIFNLDVAQEDRVLSDSERQLRATLKCKLLGFAAIDRMKWRQRSRITWIRDGDANTRFFHLRANGRRRKNHIPTLVGPRGTVSEHEEKAQILLEHFKSMMGLRVERTIELDLEALPLPRVDLSHLERRFSLEELQVAVDEMHGEKAPGPDGFIRNFFKKCWTLIKNDLLAAMNMMHSLQGQNWNLLNTASIVLLPKKNDASDAKDYRPVSLMHSAAKILCKLLANRLVIRLKRIYNF
jgi:hypothetical protein